MPLSNTEGQVSCDGGNMVLTLKLESRVKFDVLFSLMVLLSFEMTPGLL
jgi:hypothetical protein